MEGRRSLQAVLFIHYIARRTSRVASSSSAREGAGAARFLGKRHEFQYSAVLEGVTGRGTQTVTTSEVN